MKDLENILEKYFLTKAPKMPKDIQTLIVQYGPYILVLGVVMGAVSLLSMFGITASIMNPLRGYWGPGSSLGAWYQLYMAFTVIVLVLQALALPGLFQKSMTGWKYVWYAALVSLVQYVVTMNIAGIIIGSGLTFYILYQIRNHYK